MKLVIMIQRSPHKWRLESEKGHMLVDDITANSEEEAKEFVKRYISSYTNWSYDIQPLKKREKTK